MAESEFWGQPGTATTYPQALRQFVRYHANTHTVRDLQRLVRQQGELERKWYESRRLLERNGADAAKLKDFDERIHFQAAKFAEDLEIRLSEDLKLPLFRRPATSAAAKSERAKFMLFLSDFLQKD